MKISETIRYRIKEAGADFRCSNNSAERKAQISKSMKAYRARMKTA
jgi:hypothetical protein|tara:strand:+ start:546 stop:683 length:138 start_codon:yes stop_codon:yes gene_type:complete